MPFVRIVIMLLGLLLGFLAGRWLSSSSVGHFAPTEPGSLTNTISLMLAGLLAGVLLAPLGERELARARARFGGWYEHLSPRSVTAATVALLVSLLLGVLASSLLGGVPRYAWWWNVLITLVLAAFFIPFAVRNAETFGALAGTPARRRLGGRVLDSNVIIDGRVVGLVRSGLLDGRLIVPGFVLRELQFLSDHADPQRRTRGKRGLGVLEELQAEAAIVIDDWDTQELTLTDDKLVRLARETGSQLVTNDNNLSKVARLHGIGVISLNEAALALRPQLQAGDSLNVTITKAGQQAGQGVGYLEDGTMLVVEDGAKYKNRSVRVVVMNNVQTAMGRMIFAKAEPERASG